MFSPGMGGLGQSGEAAPAAKSKLSACAVCAGDGLTLRPARERLKTSLPLPLPPPPALLPQAASLGLGDSWGKVQSAYAAANRALGDIVKVTPSSKVGLIWLCVWFCIG